MTGAAASSSRAMSLIVTLSAGRKKRSMSYRILTAASVPPSACPFQKPVNLTRLYLQGERLTAQRGLLPGSSERVVETGGDPAEGWEPHSTFLSGRCR